MRELVKKIVSEFPWVYERLLDIKYSNKPINQQEDLRMPINGRGTSAEIFAEMHSRNAWADDVSRSGPGSNLNYTRRLRIDLEHFLRAYSISSMLDAPCGDYVWMKEVRFPSQFNYVGGDIIVSLVEELNIKYAGNMKKFVSVDVTNDDLPQVDLWLCRDCFIHLSNEQVLLALNNFVRSGIKFLMTTTYNFGSINTDISTGDFRLINLRRPPFSLPKPLKMIRDYVYPFPPRRLAVWSQVQLSEWADKWTDF